MTLAEYRRKREFARTREPEPGKPPPRGRRPLFVVQLHHAGRRHYDFRLQVGDALKSWAVPKGPSFDPGVKRLAVEVEDHPVAYADFEGDIPQGQYGAGHVAIFDRGVWSTAGDPQAQLEKGHLRFELFGERLRGGWHLVRSSRRARQPEWLLFKEQDAHAGAVEADDLLAGPSTRAPDAGQAAKTPARRIAALARRAGELQGARRGTLKEGPFEPELARLGEFPPAGEDWVHEAKWDGYRLLAVIKAGDVQLWSRNALPWTHRLPDIVAALRSLRLHEAALDGELVAGTGTQADFGLLQAVLSGEKQASLNYVLFDLLHLAGCDITAAPLVQRKALLQELLDAPPSHLIYSSHVTGRGEEALATALQRRLEGIISKRARSPYRGGRGDDWRKTKQAHSDEFAVVGYTLPKGRRSGLGALLLARPHGRGGWRYAGRVGSGFSGEMLERLRRRLQPHAVDVPTVEGVVDDPELRAARWLPPREVVEVFHRGIGNQGLLRQASFKTLREDKSIADLRSPQREDGMGKARDEGAGRTRKRMRKADAETPRTAAELPLSSPERVVYPDRGTRKRQVADYYLAMADWLLPEIAGRPLSIVRCPQGVGRPCFFQKHHAAGFAHVASVALEEESGTRADYLVVEDALSLMELVQFNALEFHPWGSHATTPERADRIVFDLDPGEGVAWADVRQAARDVRRQLEGLQLHSFVRTTGGKGLHVVVPLRPGCDWDLVKPFAHAFAEAMAAAEPMRFVATATKRLRKGRIFIDYLRNGRGATSVASFSLRAREGAPVAMPLRWEELGRIRGGDAFDIDSAPRRMRRLSGHPWEDYARLRQDLSGLEDRLRLRAAGGRAKKPGSGDSGGK